MSRHVNNTMSAELLQRRNTDSGVVAAHKSCCLCFCVLDSDYDFVSQLHDFHYHYTFLLHNWTPGHLHTSRYDVKLDVSSWTSRLMSLHKHDNSLLSWRASRANSMGSAEACVVTYSSKSKTPHSLISYLLR